MDYNMLKKLDTSYDDGECRVSVKFNRAVPDFTEDSRYYLLYSDVEYACKDFTWSGTLQTVRIPHKDPAMGFLLDGLISSTVGVYQRAPGVIRVTDKDQAGKAEEHHIEIIPERSSPVLIEYRRGAITVGFTKRGATRRVPLGIFLKAISGLPYTMILAQFKGKSMYLLNSFPSNIVEKGNKKVQQLFEGQEPTHEECVNMVYDAMHHIAIDNDGQRTTNYSTHWKVGRIKAFLNNLNFKNSRSKKLELGTRSIGAYLARMISVPIFGTNGLETKYTLLPNVFISTREAAMLDKLDVEELYLRVDNKNFIAQCGDSMWFHAFGYKILNDLPDLGLRSGDVIDNAILKKLNRSELTALEVITPAGKKIMRRSTESPELSDFVSIVNYLLCSGHLHDDESQTYNISNRIIVDYDKQIRQEVENTYNSIIESVGKGLDKDHKLQFPTLPSDGLRVMLKDHGNKEVTQSDVTNVMSRAVSAGKASALMASTPGEMQNVQLGQYGRIDSLHAPESDKIGSVQQMTVMAKLSEDTGEILTPLEVIRNGVATGEIKMISASKEANRYIAAWDDTLESPTTMARFNGDVTTVDRTRVDYRDVSPFQDMSIARSTIPFPEFSQPRRSLMATKMSGQALTLLYPERPLVGTGAETIIPCLYYTGATILEMAGVENEGYGTIELVNVKWEPSTALYTFVYNGHRFETSMPFTATDEDSLYCFRLNTTPNGKFALDDIVFYNQSCDINKYDYWERIDQGAAPLFEDHRKPAAALGVNLRVCYKTWGSGTIDDAITISDRLITDDTWSSIQILKYDCDLGRDRSNIEVVTPHLHTFVMENEPVITLYRTARTSKYVRARQGGDVVRVERNNNRVRVWVATVHRAEVGDKGAGRYGNKSVIARIVPQGQMPYDPDTGEAMDVCFSTLGIPSRMNLGQLLEVTLGAVMAATGRHAVVTPFYPGIKGEIEKEYKAAGLSKKRLFNPVYGKLTERPVMTGVLYCFKLEQIANRKLSALGYPHAVDPVFAQPSSGGSGSKGQAISEMETWALIAAGARKTLNNLSTYYSEAEQPRKRYFSMLASIEEQNGEPWDESDAGLETYNVYSKPAMVTQLIYRMFGLDISVAEDKPDAFKFKLLDFNSIPLRTTFNQLKGHAEAAGANEWSKLKLKAPVINPFWIETFPLGMLLGVKSLKALANGQAFYNNYTKEVLNRKEASACSKAALSTGIPVIIKMLEETSIDDCIHRFEELAKNAEDGVIQSAVVESEDGDDDFTLLQESALAMPTEIYQFLKSLKENGEELRDIVWDFLPIMPAVFRQSMQGKNGKPSEHSFQLQLEHIAEAPNSQVAYTMFKNLLGYGEQSDKNLTSIRQYFFGKGAAQGEHGKVRGSVLSKYVGFSGRSVITPLQDITVSPFFVGLPWRIAMTELAHPLAIRVMNRLDIIVERLALRGYHWSTSLFEKMYRADWETVIASLASYSWYTFSHCLTALSDSEARALYTVLREVIREIVEGEVNAKGQIKYNGSWVNPEDLPDDATIDAAVVMVGRQPTLHKKSLRSYFVKLVDGWTTQIHSVVCAGYNADFDGDTMWNVQLLGDSKVESWKTISVLQDLISEKDGSYTLQLIQDVALGLYCATTFKDNMPKPSYKKNEYTFFSSIEELRTQVEYGDMHYYDPVIFKSSSSYYLSTAGRILVNSVIPGAMSKLPFTDPDGICEQVFSKDAISCFHELLYDMPFVATGLRPKGRPKAAKIEDVLLDIYKAEGARESIYTVQSLYELGLVASDLTSITMSIDDMNSSLDLSPYLEAPRKEAQRLNTLYQMGLISKEEQKEASSNAWERSKKAARDDILDTLEPSSNMYYLLFSGARGKPDQLMQSVGFIGSISKTRTSDIEYPILRGYGQGLSSLDLLQTCYSARIGVVSTQSGTKETGYATRQSVYMTSGLRVDKAECGIENHALLVEYDRSNISVRYEDGRSVELSELVGEFVEPHSEVYERLRTALAKSQLMLTEEILQDIIACGIQELSLIGVGKVTLTYHLSPEWREGALQAYSYALPFTNEMRITEQTLDWVEEHTLKDIIAFSEEDAVSGECFDREAYMPVDYDWSKYVAKVEGHAVNDESLMLQAINPKTPEFNRYKNLLSEEGCLTPKALRWLTKCGIQCVLFSDDSFAEITYALTPLFKSVIIGRVSVGLPYLDETNCITAKTIEEIERYQLRYIPVNTSFTCLCENGICSTCYGKSLSTNSFAKDGVNLGIPASQAMCEPLSQTSLNVGHSGGNRRAGTGLISGLSYYQNILRGSTVTKKNISELEVYAPAEGYVRLGGDARVVEIADEEGTLVWSNRMVGEQELNTPIGAYVKVGETIISGHTNLDRYASADVFHSALRMRYQLVQEFQRVFEALSVSPRNMEVMARAQTSCCYRIENSNLPRVKETSSEASAPTGKYWLKLSSQAQVVNRFSGLAGYGFENVSQMLLSNLLVGETHNDSWLSNIISGTVIGESRARMIPACSGTRSTTRTAAPKEVLEDDLARMLNSETILQLNGIVGDVDIGSAPAMLLDMDKAFALLESGSTETTALPLMGLEVGLSAKEPETVVNVEDIGDIPELEALQFETEIVTEKTEGDSLKRMQLE